MDIYMVIFEALVFAAAFIIIYLYWNTTFEMPQKEHFTDVNTLNITMCPGATKSFIAKSGDTNCCDGNPAGTECEGKTVCTLSSAGSRDLPACSEYLKTYYAKKGVQVCPKSLPNYYEDDGGHAFCTAAALSQDLNGPSQKAAERCSLGGGGFKDPNSCEVRLALEKMVCPAPGCRKFAQAFGKEPVVLMATFRDNNSMTHTCYDTQSMFKVWRETLGPDWKSKLSHIDFDTNINFCDVAKKYYIDKTLSKNQVQL